MPEDTNVERLEPTTPVTIINRTDRELRDTFDGRHYTLPPGYIQCPYGAARHFKRRLTLAGTRSLDQGEIAVSCIGILGVDPEDQCQPFTAEELGRADASPEALDRSDAVLKADRDVTVQKVANKTVGRGNGSRRPKLDTSQQATAEAAERAASAFTPPATSSAEQDERSRGNDDE
jgi:hypothetical protein